MDKVGFVGFGEAAFAIAQGLAAHGVRPLFAFDRNIDDPTMGEVIRDRLRAARVNQVPDLESLLEACDLILSLVPPDVALSVASQAAPRMEGGKTFVDMNSVSPGTKKAMARLFAGTEGTFLEGVILGAIASLGYKSPILVCGEKADDFARAMNEHGLKVTRIVGDIGSASALKMLRSVFAKGVEALLLEMLIAAERSGVIEPLMEDLVQYMDEHSFKDVANTWVTTNAVHAARRTAEMDQVVGALRELSVDPIMARAIKERLQKSAESAARQHFQGRPPGDYHDVIAYLSERE